MALLEVRNLKTYFPVRSGVLRRHVDDIKAVDDVSFTVEAGTTVGLVGDWVADVSYFLLGRSVWWLLAAGAYGLLASVRRILRAHAGLPPSKVRVWRPLKLNYLATWASVRKSIIDHSAICLPVRVELAL